MQGYELQLGINNLGHFLYTELLHPLLVKTAQSAPKNSARVVWVASSAADAAPVSAIDFSNMDYLKDEEIWTEYSRSKAGNVLHAVEYARRAGSKSILGMVRFLHFIDTIDCH